MSVPNTFLSQRKALTRFRRKIPFLALIPPAIYRQLSPLEWYEPFGEIEQVRAEIEQELDCYVMTYKRFGPLIPWETQLVVYITEAHLAPEKRAVLHEVNEAERRLGIKFQAFQKPLQLRKRPLEGSVLEVEMTAQPEYLTSIKTMACWLLSATYLHI